MRILGLPGGILQFPAAFQIKNVINCPDIHLQRCISPNVFLEVKADYCL